MIQVTIKKQDVVTNQASFPSQEEAQAWLSSHEGMKTFGEPAHTVQQQVEILPAIIGEQELLDRNGNSFDPKQFEEIVLQEGVYETVETLVSEYTIEILDISSKIAQDAINSEALAFLASTDWMVIRAMERGEELSPELKAERQAARDRIIVE